MKGHAHTLLLASVFFAAATAFGDTVSQLDVSVRQKSGGKAIFQGRTDVQGNFATGNLEPGAYSVEFRSPKGVNLKGQQLAISISAAKGAPRCASASGEHLQGGVALDVDVPSASKLSGRVVSAGQSAGRQAAGSVPKGMEAVRANVKVMNGKRYVWVPGNIDSRMGGKWVEEGSDEARLSTSNKKGGDSDFLRNRQDQSGNIGQR